jgi:hypothetical protein
MLGTLIPVENPPVSATEYRLRQLLALNDGAASASATKVKFADRSLGLIWSGQLVPAELEPAIPERQPTPEPAPVAKPLWNVTMLGVMAEKRPESVDENIERHLAGYGRRTKEDAQ